MCLWIPPINFLMPEPIFMKLGMNIMAPKPILSKSLPSVCESVCVSLLSLLGNGSVKCVRRFIARQCLGTHVPAPTNTRHKTIAGRVCLSIPLFLLGNNSIKTFLRQRRIVGGFVFCAFRVISNKDRRLVLPRTSSNVIFISVLL
jgi:hypothetical protein